MRRIPAVSLAAVALLAFVGLFVSCSRSKPNADALPAGSVSLTGAGSSFDAILFNRWFTVYHDSHPNIFVKYSSVGSGEGVRRFIGQDIGDEEKVDFGASDSAMSDVEIARANDNALMIPVTSACLVLAYNLPDFHGDLKLS